MVATVIEKMLSTTLYCNTDKSGIAASTPKSNTGRALSYQNDNEDGTGETLGEAFSSTDNSQWPKTFKTIKLAGITV
jgi:hypothetical protein